MARSPLETEELWQRFHDVVNMTSRELVDWLGVQADLDAPRPGPVERAQLGDAVVGILGKRRTDLTDDDLDAMRKVIEVVETETDGVTKEQILSDERRRHRLMTVGHDPFREAE
ncbi:DUF3140 domain-containing protein [Jiangella gansuensis]|uniref:DUF3140 domain-containing protein n=1 Tax=Jiangella gansuensis TaxID=281473 RepID=UPI00047C86D0|nr:DUF3140 domain-containing protein [Jiangella gansuensis]